MKTLYEPDTIVAQATPPGKSAIAVIRLSGKDSINIVQKIFNNKELNSQPTHTIHFGDIFDKNGDVIDEVLVSIFKGSKSFTKETSVEISCHGSQYIVQKIITLLLDKGARIAHPGEFTKRAYLNGRFDLLQAEAVADVINSESESAHKIAINQMRGGFSSKIHLCRDRLIALASLLELELDFSEEDITFADRREIVHLTNETLLEVDTLLKNFEQGNAIKNGIPIPIVGKPNVGKSTLLNALINEDRAITSSIPGTTRDTLEETIYLDSIKFRLIDTAGLRTDPDNEIEAIGIQKTKQQISKAPLILYLFDLSTETIPSMHDIILQNQSIDATIIYVGNKLDLATQETISFAQREHIISISAYNKQNLCTLKNTIIQYANTKYTHQTLSTNTNHIQSLKGTKTALQNVLNGIHENTSSDLLMQNIRLALSYLATLTGNISPDDILETIFSHFCIGK